METEDNKDSTENDSYVTHKTSKVLELEKMVASYPEYFYAKRISILKIMSFFPMSRRFCLTKWMAGAII